MLNFGFVPTDPKELPSWLQQFLPQLAVALGRVELQELGVVPAKVFTGLTVLANGTTWNPGAGPGVYTYYGGAWHKLG